MNELIFNNQGTWAGMTADQFQTWLDSQATTLGLDQAKFDKDMKSDAVVNKVAAAQKEATDMQLTGTPTLFFNGRQLGNISLSLESFSQVVDLIPKMAQFEQEHQFKACPAMTIDPKKQYQATLKTDKGDIVIQLFADKAPMAVNNFVFLAKQGWYNGVTFHRVIASFVAQSGDPSGEGWGGPGYVFDNEISPDLKFDKAGVVGMANRGPGTNGSQFFITFAAQPSLDGNYTIFGKVVSGMDVALKLTPRDASTTPNAPPGDKIQSIVIEEK